MVFQFSYSISVEFSCKKGKPAVSKCWQKSGIWRSEVNYWL